MVETASTQFFLKGNEQTHIVGTLCHTDRTEKKIAIFDVRLTAVFCRIFTDGISGKNCYKTSFFLENLYPYI